MDEQELLDLFLSEESSRVERKSQYADKLKDSICKTICAFANDLPNHKKPCVIFIGQNDDGGCAHLSITDDLKRKITNIHNERKIMPFPVWEVDEYILNDCHVLAIIVHPSQNTPVRYEGEIYVRIGSTNRIARSEEERELIRKSIGTFYDIYPVNMATINDLDLNYLQLEYFPRAVSNRALKENNRSIEHQLSSLHLLTKDRIPTVLGLLVGGIDTRYFLPNAYIQFLRIAGTEIGDPIIDHEEIDGILDNLIKRIKEKLRIHIATALNPQGDERAIIQPDYPLDALEELVANAVIHRTYEGTNAPVRITWYDDRIEIWSPGGPYGLVNKDNFGQMGIVDYRNPHLASAAKYLGHVEKFGFGISAARRSLQKNNNPQPEFLIENEVVGGNFVLVTVRKAQ
ncbi:MAG: transcriptional regulator [Phototrophicales bacterium]|nr:MAG: transcriptional regulator [Phototrophicales bacterium]